MESKENHLKIAFLTATDPADKKIRSGTMYYIYESLQKHFEVYPVGPIKTKIEIIAFYMYKISKIFFKKKYVYLNSILLSKAYARIINHKISEESFDVIVAPLSSPEIAFLKTEIPIVYLSDTTFSLINNYYEDFTGLLDISVKECNFIEKSAINKADLILYPSKWAAKSAVDDYHADESKVHVIPFGANIEDIPPKELIMKKKKSEKCRLLFLGADWDRKGGNIAFDALLELESLGTNAELIICGCIPPEGISHERMIVIPYLDKNDEIQRKKLNDLFSTSDFLFLPTRAEAYGIVFCEANAYGLPVITTDTGGVSGVIDQGKNGFMLPIDATGMDYARIIHDIYQNDEKYFELVKSSRNIFDLKLNWDKWGIEVSNLIEKMV